MNRSMLIASVGFSLLSPLAVGQYRVLHAFDGGIGYSFGQSVKSAGDVNGDGTPDLIVGQPNYNDPFDSSPYAVGRAQVFSGQDGSLLYSYVNTTVKSDFGYSVSSAGDVNADGYADVVVGAPFDGPWGAVSGMAKVYSGLDGSTLHTFWGATFASRFGAAVSDAGDVDGDGFGDVIVGAELEDNRGLSSGTVQVFSGRTGALLHSLDGVAESDKFGRSVSGVGDIDHDGFDDFVVGSNRDPLSGQFNGSAQVFSGRNGSSIFFFTGDDSWDDFGRSVSGAGDVNGDGYGDIIVGNPLDVSGGVQGSATVFSGFDAQPLHIFSGSGVWHGFGISVSGAGDVNGDGFDDLIVGGEHEESTPDANTGRALVYSGMDGSVLFSVEGQSSGQGLGTSVAGAGDIDGDGLSDVIIGIPFGAPASALVVAAGGLAPPSPFCFGDGTGTDCPCANGTSGAGCASSSTSGAALGALGQAQFLFDSFGLTISGMPAFKAGLCVKGSGVLNGGNGGLVGDGLLCTSPQLRSQVVLSGASGQVIMEDWRGVLFGEYPGSANVGAPTFYQWWYRDPASSCSGQGFNFSNGLEVNWW